MSVLSVRTFHDGLLGAIAPLGLAAAAGTALVVDLDPDGPSYPGPASLADLASAGPRRADLRPGKAGVAVLRNGGADQADVPEIIEALIEGWPAVVLRHGPGGNVASTVPTVTIHPLLPGVLAAGNGSRVVYQRTGFAVRPPGPGPVLPRPAARTISRLLRGIAPGPSRWVRAWRGVWEWA